MPQRRVSAGASAFKRFIKCCVEVGAVPLSKTRLQSRPRFSRYDLPASSRNDCTASKSLRRFFSMMMPWAPSANITNRAAGENEIHGCRNVLDGGLATDDRWVSLGILLHFFWTSRAAVTAEVDQIHVITPRRDVLHPGCVAKFEIKGSACWISRARARTRLCAPAEMQSC